MSLPPHFSRRGIACLLTTLPDQIAWTQGTALQNWIKRIPRLTPLGWRIPKSGLGFANFNNALSPTTSHSV